MASSPVEADILIIGGGVNGCGIARDAAGRGLAVVLVEQGDLGAGTSSASTKLFHGGLRYLQYWEFRLVREALIERETLLQAMPHISRPLRFVLPHHPGLKPAWLLRLGLLVYDHLGGRRILPGTRSLDLAHDPAGRPLKPRFRRAFEYSDCWVDDARLVVLNARDAAARGARVLVRTRCVAARPEAGAWRAELRTASGETVELRARVLVNAAGPWVGPVLAEVIGSDRPARVRLVRGSHIVTRRLFEHDRAYTFIGGDGRVVFAIPYEDDFTLIGTTDEDHAGPPEAAACTEAEVDYLRAAVSAYFREPVEREAIVWTYAGVRPLRDDGAKSPTAATRDYELALEMRGGAPLLTVHGGKITTYRRLAEAVLARLGPHLPAHRGPWTAGVPLPGGDFPYDAAPRLVERLRAAHPFLDPSWAWRLVRAYGTEAPLVLAGARSLAGLGRRFGHDLTEAEVAWLMEREFATTAEDVLWRRTKLGLRLSAGEAAALEAWMASRPATPPGAAAAAPALARAGQGPGPAPGG